MLRNLVLTLILPLTALAHAEPVDSPTLQKIARTGTINLGHRESSVPFSYYDARKQVVGYSHELMLAVVEDVRKELRLPALAIRLVPITSQNRIPLVQNGSIDLECGSTTHNRERDRQAGFSVSIFQTSARLLTRTTSGVRDVEDLRGQKVLVTAGTTSERQLMLYQQTHGGRFNIIAAADHGDAFTQLQNGAAAAFLMDDAVLYGLRAKAERPSDWTVVGQPLSIEVYACMFRKGDTAFKAIVDRSLVQLMRSGEALKIYRKWFQSPIPPKGLNLNWPAPEHLLELYRNPSDAPLN
ncbi:transporter substrate-binding domain-containing protein [Curvibacter sp. APW13]|uniref:transporter substrate-binding domain-containing protein n=1 Tax=Curvibacter sp. APW13 TaxID=3077236 RepID=UPI0028DF05B5|nr:transporter substrate-binding domain-containing protein [Curvibacter sp. APW13]MDT8991082.1 transporter substrate-binding domain-containing protein [Curvibacter sp. APW13]